MSSSSHMFPWSQDAHVWQGAEDNPGDDEVSGDEGKRFAEGSAAGDILAEFLLTLLLEGKMSAKTMCTICFWAKQSGAKGKASEFAYRPDLPPEQSGHYFRHVDTVNGVRMKDLAGSMYHMATPGLAKYDLSRTSHDMPVSLPHEVIADEINNTPGMLEEAQARADAREWPPQYYTNPVVRKAGLEVVLPLALYMDGISMTRNDSIFGVFLYSLQTLKRHLIAVFRKSFLCKCGCGGRCTLLPLWVLLHWSLTALANGKWPSRKHDGTPWAQADGQRAEQAGKRMYFRGCVLQVKADWAEFSKTLGFTSWASTLYPCPFCKMTKDDMYNVEGFSPVDTPWPPLTQEDMDRAAAACEVWVLLSEVQHKEVLAALQYEKSKTGPRGRGLVKDIPTLGLLRGDRLEPHAGMLDVATFDTLDRFPANVKFWRRNAETRVSFRNPLWDKAGLGLSVENLAVDILHTVYLGPALAFVSFCLWYFIDSDLWGLGQGQSRDTRWQVNVQHLRNLLRSYYSRCRRAEPDRSITELEDLTLNMMGAKKGALANFKAAETKHIVPWVVELLRSAPNIPGALRSNLVGAGQAMLALINCVDDGPPVLPPASVQLLHDQYKRCMKFFQLAGIRMRPKNHLMGHLVNRATTQGNPANYSTFEDEGLNAVLKLMGASAHRMVWEYRVFSSFSQWEGRKSAKRLRR